MKKLTIIILLITITAAYGQSVDEWIRLNEEATKLYNQANFHGAARKWQQGLKITKKMNDQQGIAIFTGNLGFVYDDLGDYQKSLSYYEQALAINRAIGDKKWIGRNLTNIGNVYDDLGDYQKALSYYERALEIDREIGDKKGEGDDLGNIGNAYYNLSDYQKALPYYERALEIKREIGDRKGIGNNLGNIGMIYYDLGDYQKALSYYERALEIKREIGDRKGIGRNLGNIGLVYYNLGDYQKALSYYERALEIDREIGDKKGEGADLGNIGLVYDDLGNYQKALSHHERALEIDREIGDKKGEGGNLGNIGVVYRNLGDYQKALSYYERALEIHRAIGDKKDEGGDLTNIGLVYTNLGDYQKALSYYERALAIGREIGVPTGTQSANMADVWLKLGEIDKAEQVFIDLNWPIRLGNLNLVKNNYAKALDYFERALQSDLQSRSAEFLFADYAGLGKGYEGQRDYSRAIENYEKAMTLAEQQRETLAEAEKARFFAAEIMNFKRIVPYEGLVRSFQHKQNLPQAFFYAENLKARMLTEAMASGYGTVEQELPANLVEQEQSYTTQIRGLRKQMEALFRNKAMDSYYEKERELKTVKAKQRQFISRLRQQYPEYAAINYPQPIHATQVMLNTDEILVEFEVTESETEVFLLANGKLKSRTVNISRDSLQTLVLDYRGFFENIRTTSQLGVYYPNAGKKLYDLLFGKTLTSIAEGSTLIIVPDEILGILPFEALVTDMPMEKKYGDSEFGPFPLGVTYLADKYLISYAQSATSLTLLRTLKKTTGAGNNMLVVADPIFSADDSRLNLLAQAKMSADKVNLMGALADWKQMGLEGVRFRGEKRDISVNASVLFPRLKQTEALAQALESLFGGKAVVFSGTEAKEDKVRTTDLSQYRYLTFATHGILDRTVPYIKEPALVLTQVGNPEGYDGFLTMSEVMGLKLNAEVVALTACETGVGKNVSGEGVMGMGRAFQFAGAQSVLVSLWSVAETSATQLAAAFFKYLKEGKEPKQAIRFARNEIRRQGYEHPFYWSSFILFGK